MNEFFIIWCAGFAAFDFTIGSPVVGSVMVGLGIVYIIKAVRARR